jgi:hypothetical protein
MPGQERDTSLGRVFAAHPPVSHLDTSLFSFREKVVVVVVEREEREEREERKQKVEVDVTSSVHVSQGP